MGVEVGPNGYRVIINDQFGALIPVDAPRLQQLVAFFSQYKVTAIKAAITRANADEQAVHCATSPNRFVDPAVRMAAMSSYKVYKKEARIKRLLRYSKLTNRVVNTWHPTNVQYHNTVSPHMYFMIKAVNGDAPLTYTLTYYYKMRGSNMAGASIFGTGAENPPQEPRDEEVKMEEPKQQL